jgi:molybdopterin adenylyltransferase
VLDREAPGIAEAMRAETAKLQPLSWLSRGVAGTRGPTLVVNLPGNPKAVRECLDVLAPLLPHALKLSSGG